MRTQQMYKFLRKEAARALWLSRRFKGDCSLDHWYNGRYTAYKQSADLLKIAMDHDEAMSK